MSHGHTSPHHRRGAAEGEALESGIGTWYKENLKLHYTNTHSLT